MNPTRLYLDLLRKSLLNELYLENEARLLYMFSCAHAQRPVDAGILREIRTRSPQIFDSIRESRDDGRPWWQITIRTASGEEKTINLRNVCEFSHTMVGRQRMRNLEECLDHIREDAIPGDLAETGVWRGGSVIFMRGYLEAYGMPDRKVWAADSFEGLPPSTHPLDAGRDYSKAEVPILAVSLDDVKDLFARYGLLDDRVVFLKGWFRDTLPAAPIGRLALLRLDGDLYESTRDAIEPLYDKVVPGGFIIIDDYGDFAQCRKAVDEFRERRGITDPIHAIDWSGAFWRKS